MIIGLLGVKKQAKEGSGEGKTESIGIENGAHARFKGLDWDSRALELGIELFKLRVENKKRTAGRNRDVARVGGGISITVDRGGRCTGTGGSRGGPAVGRVARKIDPRARERRCQIPRFEYQHLTQQDRVRARTRSKPG